MENVAANGWPELNDSNTTPPQTAYEEHYEAQKFCFECRHVGRSSRRSCDTSEGHHPGVPVRIPSGAFSNGDGHC